MNKLYKITLKPMLPYGLALSLAMTGRVKKHEQTLAAEAPLHLSTGNAQEVEEVMTTLASQIQQETKVLEVTNKQESQQPRLIGKKQQPRKILPKLTPQNLQKYTSVGY